MTGHSEESEIFQVRFSKKDYENKFNLYIATMNGSKIDVDSVKRDLDHKMA